MIPTLFKRSANRFSPALRRAGVGLVVLDDSRFLAIRYFL